MQKNRNVFIILNVVAVAVIGWILLSAVRAAATQPMTWTDAKAKVAADQVESVEFDGDRRVLMKLKAPADNEPAIQTVYRVEADDEAFVGLLDAHRVPYSQKQPGACEGK